MTLFYYDPVFLEHDTGDHPENAERLGAVITRLEQSPGWNELVQPDFGPASIDQIGRVHTADAIESIDQFISDGGGRIEADTVVSGKSMVAARMAVGAAIDATGRVLSGEDKTAFCLVRPPGHHALSSHPMGFCLLNNVAVAARSAIEQQGLSRVMIVDWDVHHGNGTQAVFWDDPSVAFLSMHRYPFYPGSGATDEVGQGAGRGLTVNLPVEFGTSPADQIVRFRAAVEDLADRFRPELVLISAGFDSHRRDPIGSLELESEDFIELTNIMLDVAATHAGGRVVSLLEGGYDPTALAECVDLHVATLASRK